ncbi:MAG TPA: DUF349 domain-containing protein [Jiangellaceae bacterium]|nr:DUF349 domain-containing protein [Jiangellaceae bacterium]
MSETPTPAQSGPAGDGSPSTAASNEFGRVDSTGEVYVRIDGTEIHIGSWQVGAPQQALDFFGRKFADLTVQVDLLEQRLAAGAATPDDVSTGVAKVREAMKTPHAIGDYTALSARLVALDESVAQHREQRKAARAQAQSEARTRKEAITAEAEQIAAGQDWKSGADRLRTLLDEWKGLPRLDRRSDDALWRRFSGARTQYTRHRKAHFSAQAERREAAKVTKEKLLKEAEAIAHSTDWGETSRRYRDLMSQWKAAGPAPRGVEDTLWKRFRAAQDTFFEARSAAYAERDAEQRTNLEAKQALVAEAEALLPVTDWKAARATLRDIQDRWEQIGHVPRDSMRSIEGALRSVEDAVRDAQDAEWNQTNPEARARAEATVEQLESSISQLQATAERARSNGDSRRLREAEEAVAARQTWLEQARGALSEFQRPR